MARAGEAVLREVLGAGLECRPHGGVVHAFELDDVPLGNGGRCEYGGKVHHALAEGAARRAELAVAVFHVEQGNSFAERSLRARRDRGRRAAPSRCRPPR